MASVAAVSTNPIIPPLPPIPVHRFTVAQYHRMIATGVLTENDRVELLDGWIVDTIRQPIQDEIPRQAGKLREEVFFYESDHFDRRTG